MSTSPATDFGVLLNLAFSAFKEALEADLAAAGFGDIGPSFGYVFRRLDEGPCSLGELARQLGMSAPGALKVVDDMVAKGYVARRAHAQDRRIKQLELTARGRAALDHARRFHAGCEGALKDRLGAPCVAAARTALEALAFDGGAARARRPRPL